ncbi:hypothetical protein [Kribbella solani]|uniref:Lipoprotein n=1 Tax=Kribbella solani TaxID=236067 RepID=A0A841DTR2_9ACTN|nr:hypothetical protein [Kribbella solani]MBB5981993.1 hypothetical protein [Kribbella solani]MDX3001223.1 hypothetical protein [Kribbella solani]
MGMTRKAPAGALAVIAVLALAACGNGNDPAPVGGDKKSEKSPLAEYMGDGFATVSGGGAFVSATRLGGGKQPSEEDLAKQRKVEDATVACMKNAGFEYIAVAPDSAKKGKFDDAFNLPPDKFAEQYGYGISTIDWSKAGPDDSSDPNKKIRDALSPTAQKAYDKALNGDGGGPAGTVKVEVGGDGPSSKGQLDQGCRGKAAADIYGKGEDREADFKKYENLFKDIQALSQRIDADPRVVDATKAWSDCLADAGQPGFKKLNEPQEKIRKELDTLTGNKPSGDGPMKVQGPPSFDKVDAAKLGDLRKEEIALATADQKCKASKYNEPYKTVQYELEKEFVAQNKAQLEAYRDGMANR